jgi:flagellar hook-length control protein FliK
MSQIATFFNPVPLPTAAGVSAFESNAATPDESFAATLLNLNALLGIADPNAPAPIDAIPSAEFLGSVAAPVVFPPATAQTSPSINVETPLAAQLAILQDVTVGTAALSTLVAPQANAGIDAESVPASTAAINLLELRGTFAPAGNTNAKPSEPAKRAAPATQSDAARRATPAVPAEPAPANARSTKPVEGASSSAIPPLAGQSQNPSSEGGQPAAAGSAQQTAPAVGATLAPVLPTIIAAQQLGAALVATQQTAVPLDALAVHIARKFEQGSSEFEIRLHPADLGQLDITLTVAEDGRVQATLRAERPETLELLQRDARSLEQQLRHAGLDVGSNALSFSLSNGQNQRQAPLPAWPSFADASDAADIAPDQAISNYVAVRVRDGIDIRV